MAHDNFERYKRPKSQYSVADLCAYARDILRDLGEDPTQSGRVVASWYSGLANVTLFSQSLDTANPIYQANIQDNRELGHHRVYTMTPQGTSVNMFDMNRNPIAVDNTEEMIVLMMFYLRTNPQVPEPRISAEGEQRFQAIAANVAIDTALEKNKIDLGRLMLTHGTPFGDLYAVQALDCAKEQSVEEGGIQYPYTRNSAVLKRELAARVWQRYAQTSQYNVPPAVNENDT